MTSEATRELARAKLASSGLDEKDAALLGITAHDNLKQLHDSFDAIPGLRFSFYHPCTRKELSAWPKYPPYYRVRKLAKPEQKGFDKATEQKEDKQKYSQPPGSGVCAYFPMNLDLVIEDEQLSWMDIAGDVSVPIYITEGELKAAKACKEGFPCIGLGGVDSFRQVSWGRSILPEMRDIMWVSRPVFITFDADMTKKPQVVRALNALAEMLMEEGARPYLICLPEIEGVEKVGLDDFLLHKGADAFDMLKEQAQILTQIEGLFKLNEKYAYVRHSDRILELSTGVLREPSVWAKGTEARATCYDYSVMPDGALKYEAVSAAPMWLRWGPRHDIAKIDYLPHLDPRVVVEDDNGDLVYNTWHGWGCQPAKGDVTLFKQLVQHLFSGPTTSPGDLEWFWQWLAYPVQRPGTKLASAALIWGIAHGTGKSMLGEIMGDIYGQDTNFKELDQMELMGSFNAWADGKQFVMVNEVEGQNRKESTMMFKNFITRQNKSINKKHVNPFDQLDRINYYFTSNLPNALIIEDSDRRFFIIEAPQVALSDEYYSALKEWRLNGGPSALHHYLKHEVDLKGFNPSAPARLTRAKQQMQGIVKTDLGAVLAELRAHPEEFLKVGMIPVKCDIFTPAQIQDYIDPHKSMQLSAQVLGRELKQAGFNQVGESTVTYKGKSHRFYIIRNQEKWTHATMAQIRQHLADTDTELTAAEAKKGKF